MSYVEVIRQREEMLQSYCDAIRNAGGCPKRFLDRLEHMTVREMIDMLAQNGVRFTTVTRVEEIVCVNGGTADYNKFGK